MSRPYISVLVDTYNHERFIEEALVSVLEQNVADAECEILVVDDGSIDRTPEIVRKFAPRVRLIRKKNGGQASAFNAGIPECAGEIVAFLDGDDWWAPGKLPAVADALASDEEVGLVGHGITQVFADGRHETELVRDTPRFRITSRAGAEAFRLRKSFLGTSRSTYRASILRKIGAVPETLRFQADEYLFTLAGLFADVLILREALTFYRLHDSNLFQFTNGNADAIRRKGRVLATLAGALQDELQRRGVERDVAEVIVSWVQNEADQELLVADGGTPWKTIRTELNTYRVAHQNASAAHWIFKCATLLPACVLPPRTYYSWKRKFAANGLYRKSRQKWLPYLQPGHIDRYHDKPGPLTTEVGRREEQPLNILMAAGVPKRREGGVATIVYNLGREMENRGHRVTYLFLEDLVAPGSALPRFRELIFSARLAKYVAAHRNEFSLLNLHAPTGLVYGLKRKWLGRRSGPPYVMTLHGLEERRVEVMTREAKKGRAWNFAWKNRAWHRVYHFPRFRWAIRTADGAHVYSREVWNLLRLKYGLTQERVAYIPNGVEQRFFAPERRYVHGQTIRLLYAGTWLDQRGIFYIRDVMLRLAPRIPGLKLTVAGPGTSAEEVLQFFGPELAAHIEVRPLIAAEKMQELYAEHDIFVFPSLMEGLPSVLLEAMANGMPVITAATCGMPDMVENGINGLLVPPADAAALENAIVQLAESQELRARLGQAAQESMRRYEWSSAARELEDLFFRVVKAEASASA